MESCEKERCRGDDESEARADLEELDPDFQRRDIGVSVMVDGEQVGTNRRT